METFYGVEVIPGKTSAFVPPPLDAQLHLSQATLSFDAKEGERVGVTVKVHEDGPDVLICSLREGTSESQSLDLIFDSYAEFKVVGNASVHLSGYYMPEHDHDDEDFDEEDDGDEDEEMDSEEHDEQLGKISGEDLRALAAYGRKHGLPDLGSIEEVETSDEDDEDDDEDEDEDDEEDDADEELARRAFGVVIKELNQDGSEHVDTDENRDDEEKDDEDDEDEEAPAGAVQIDGAIGSKKGAVQEEDDEEEDEDEEDEEEEEEEGAPAGAVQIDGAVGVKEGAVRIDVDIGAPAKRKGAAAKEAPASKRAKKAADIARATAEDLITQAIAEDEAEENAGGMIDVAAAGEPAAGKAADAADIIDVAAASKPAAEEIAAPPVEEAEPAGEKPLSKKAKKRKAKDAAANGQIQVAAAEEPGSKSVPIKHTRPKVQKFDNGFIIEDTHMGPPQGKEAKPGNKVSVRYKGWLAKNNQVFDQTKGSKTFNFRVGVGEVIKGWDRGVVGMRPGDKRRLTVPPQMAYGPTGVKGAIPGNATLVFDVELVDSKGK